MATMKLQQYCDNRPHTGYGTQLMYKEGDEAKYHLLIPLETVPTVTGSIETYDFDILTCTSRGQLSGKESLESADNDFMWHRDNIHRLKQLRGKTLNMLKVHADFTAEAFVGTIEFTSQEVSAEVDRGTITITPTSIDKDYILNCRDIIQPTAWFETVIPDVINVGTTAATLSVTVRPTNATISGVYIDEKGNTKSSSSLFKPFTAPTVTDGVATLSFERATNGSAGSEIIALTISATGYAPWTTTIVLERDS